MTVQYLYLEEEDAQFARAFRLSEDEALGMFGGLKGYTQHRFDRVKARAIGYTVPALPSTIESQIESLKFTELTEKQWAEHLVSEHIHKVQGCLDAAKVDDKFRANGSIGIS